MGLRIASVDLVLSRPSDEPPKRCTVLEVNSAPGLDTHEREPGWTRRRVERVSRIVLALDVGSSREVDRMATKTTKKKPAAKPAPRRPSRSTSRRRRSDKRAALAKLRKAIKIGRSQGHRKPQLRDRRLQAGRTACRVFRLLEGPHRAVRDKRPLHQITRRRAQALRPEQRHDPVPVEQAATDRARDEDRQSARRRGYAIGLMSWK